MPSKTLRERRVDRSSQPDLFIHSSPPPIQSSTTHSPESADPCRCRQRQQQRHPAPLAARTSKGQTKASSFRSCSGSCYCFGKVFICVDRLLIGRSVSRSVTQPRCCSVGCCDDCARYRSRWPFVCVCLCCFFPVVVSCRFPFTLSLSCCVVQEVCWVAV